MNAVNKAPMVATETEAEAQVTPGGTPTRQQIRGVYINRDSKENLCLFPIPANV